MRGRGEKTVRVIIFRCNTHLEELRIQALKVCHARKERLQIARHQFTTVPVCGRPEQMLAKLDQALGSLRFLHSV